ncbi:MAG TPA: 3-hydroxyacyl-CoA dehydrogenase NAD-binding domain-containing protein [bacterium]|nr:3-hydroxyacyl-CoA dehydrogenase NAD-binding domain-containing protein [bacterium]HOL48372.1 3-hydroxyacyl-CoA dehydrogenase NAD-binding domain-containing protein [bacterium]HPQ19661.1 3-hydroxyacyl-CoA dehydrogenase NAD-binding domain-containing protein [bacterium]
MKKIKIVGLFGFGTIGRIICKTLLSKNYSVIVFEPEKKELNEKMKLFENEINKAIERWSLTPSEKKAMFANLRLSSDFQEAKEVDLVIEAIPENLNQKANLFETLDKICNEDVIFITNTCTISITELAAKTKRQDKVIGCLFVFPVQELTLVEIVRGLLTSDDTYQKINKFIKSLSKETIEVVEYPGYVSTRIILTYINEAFNMVMEGIASAQDIDNAIKIGYNFPIGPITLANKMGLDEILLMLQHLFTELGDVKYKPCPLILKLVRAGYLGDKVGKGVFDYYKK